LKIYVEKNKRGLPWNWSQREFISKRRIKGLNTKDFQGEREIIFIKGRFHLFVIKMKEQGLKYKKASQELFRNYSFAQKSLEKVLWKRKSRGRVAQDGESLILSSLDKERLTGRKR
jgi:hypothetical protein